MAIRAGWAIAVGVATWYGEPYVGGPLYCGGVYAETTAPWVALPVSEYARNRAQCGDVIRLEFPGGQVLYALALDAGPLSKYYIADWPDLAIVADVPEHVWKGNGNKGLGLWETGWRAALSARVRLVNESLARREFERWVNRLN